MRKNSTCFVFLAGVLGVKILVPRSVARASRRREGSALQRIPHVQRLFYATPRRRGFPGLTSVGACSYTVRFARLAPIGFAPRSGGLVSGVLDSTSLLLFTTLLFTTLLLSCFIGSPAPSMVPFKGLGLQPLVPFNGSTPLMRPAALETNCRVAWLDLSQQRPASLARVQARQGGLAGGATYAAHASRHARTVCV